jgi:hypothetical protein
MGLGSPVSGLVVRIHRAPEPTLVAVSTWRSRAKGMGREGILCRVGVELRLAEICWRKALEGHPPARLSAHATSAPLTSSRPAAMPSSPAARFVPPHLRGVPVLPTHSPCRDLPRTPARSAWSLSRRTSSQVGRLSLRAWQIACQHRGRNRIATLHPPDVILIIIKPDNELAIAAICREIGGCIAPKRIGSRMEYRQRERSGLGIAPSPKTNSPGGLNATSYGVLLLSGCRSSSSPPAPRSGRPMVNGPPKRTDCVSARTSAPQHSPTPAKYDARP